MNILVLTFWPYKDGLVQTYTLPYLRIISKLIPESSTIYLLTLEKKIGNVSVEEKRQIDLQLKSDKIKWISHPYRSIGVLATINYAAVILKLWWLIWVKNIKFIHSFCTPAGVAGLILSKLTPAKFVIDSYEPHAEASVESGDWKPNSFAFKFLFQFEKWITSSAEYIIGTTTGMRDYARRKYHISIGDNFFVKPACVNLELFSEKNIKKPELIAELNLKDKIVCVYAGKFGGIYLSDDVFEFLKVAYDYWGDRFRFVLLTAHTTDEITSFCEKNQLNPSIIISRFVMHKDVPDYLGLGDFGITPVKPIPTKRYCTPIKNGEYWALGLPIISTPNISDDSDIIQERKIGSILEGINKAAYLKSIKEIDSILNGDRTELHNKIRQTAIEFRSFKVAEEIYRTIYGRKSQNL